MSRDLGVQRAPDGGLWLYPGNGVGGFLDNGQRISTGWNALTGIYPAGDFSGDRIPDVLARTPTGAMRLYRGNGSEGFIDNGVQIGAQWNAFRLIVLVAGRAPTGTVIEDGEWIQDGDGSAPEDGVNPDGSRYAVATIARPPDQQPDINLGACNDGKKISPSLPPGFTRTSRVTLDHLKSKTVHGVTYIKIMIDARTDEAWEGYAKGRRPADSRSRGRAPTHECSVPLPDLDGARRRGRSRAQALVLPHQRVGGPRRAASLPREGPS